VCKSWYCSPLCQANHWAVHRKECIPIPSLEWPDGTRYLPQGQVVRLGNNMQEGVPMLTDGPASEEESINMKDMLIGRVMIEEVKATVTEEDPSSEAHKSIAISSTSAPPTIDSNAGNKSSTDPKENEDDAPPQFKEKTCPTVPLSKVQAQTKAEIASPVPDTKLDIPAKPENTKTVSLAMSTTDQQSQVVVDTKQAMTSAEQQVVKTNQVNKSTTAQPATVKPPVEKSVDRPEQSGRPEITSTKSGDSRSKSDYTPAYVSTTLPAQSPPGHITQVILPVEEIQSPGNLSVRLVSEEAALLQLVEEMNERPPPVVAGWKVGKMATVAVYWDNIWYRGLAVKKAEGKFSIFLLDFGSLVTVAPDKLRPLPAKLGTIPAAAYQVCLAGVGPVQGDVWGGEVGGLLGEIINADMEYKFGVEFLGQLEGGRWLVKMKGVEDEEDIGQMLIDGGLVKIKEDVMMTTILKSQATKSTSSPPLPSVSTDTPSVVATAKMEEPKSKKEEVIAVMSKISRGVLQVNTTVGVVFMNTPDNLYVCPSSSLDKFLEILSSAQEAPAGSVDPMVGSCCLAMDEDCWYRGEVIKLHNDKATATIFLLDYGKTVKVPVDTLRPLPDSLANTPGLVCQVALAGVRPQGEEWSQEEIAGAHLVMDVGGDTQFNVTEVRCDDTKAVVRMKDVDGNDITDLMIETGLACKVVIGVKDDLSLIPGSLSPGQQKLLVLAAISPMELHLCTQEQFQYFSDTIVPCVEAEAGKADKVVSVVKDDLVLACEDQVWYRAVVKESLSKEEVKVELVDLALVTEVHKDNLRTVNTSVLKDPVVAVSCCLDSWAEEDKKVAREKWGSKMGSILEQYTEVDVEVIEMVENQVRVKAPKVEQKFRSTEVSRADMLKMKLKQKK